MIPERKSFWQIMFKLITLKALIHWRQTTVRSTYPKYTTNLSVSTLLTEKKKKERRKEEQRERKGVEERMKVPLPAISIVLVLDNNNKSMTISFPFPNTSHNFYGNLLPCHFPVEKCPTQPSSRSFMTANLCVCSQLQQ